MSIFYLFKRKKPEVKRLYIPEDKLEKFYELREKLSSSELAKYCYWKFIIDSFPEIRGKSFRVEVKHIFTPYIEYEVEPAEGSAVDVPFKRGMDDLLAVKPQPPKPPQ
jgi:hypothetical protein